MAICAGDRSPLLFGRRRGAKDTPSLQTELDNGRRNPEPELPAGFNHGADDLSGDNDRPTGIACFERCGQDKVAPFQSVDSGGNHRPSRSEGQGEADNDRRRSTAIVRRGVDRKRPRRGRHAGGYQNSQPFRVCRIQAYHLRWRQLVGFGEE